jgi:hypothetical protein
MKAPPLPPPGSFSRIESFIRDGEGLFLRVDDLEVCTTPTNGVST